ncbi:adult-specific rigid cuticular protein 15.7 [Trichonephila inaurata madagascariensis]|uniref:Adult-specific rigid cuticular protein 15.7 n=1 Tax=Trichonephila inaurata madagascariensis TaxID=2747483 RepID=A0A8X7BX98_9ARAC|nr:adult-specific rigid cuticular protein 15.7 [Trichonephila inaurata madagascariensis]
MMKVLIVIVAILACASAQATYRPQVPQYAPIPYSFNYLAEGDEGTSGHQETGDGAGNVQGSYTLTDQDGRRRVVEYTAGADGFKATVRTNEPGTDNSNPADAVFESTAPDARGPIIMYGNAASQRYTTTNRNQPQGMRYVLVPSTDPRARRQ